MSEREDNVIPFRRPTEKRTNDSTKSIKSARESRRAARKAARNKAFADQVERYEKQSASFGYYGVNFRPGQNVICRIVHSEPGGYAVVVDPPKVPGWTWGFMPSDRLHSPGAEVVAQFVCWDKGRLLLSELFSAGSGENVEYFRPEP